MAEDALALARCRFDGWDAAGAPEVWALPQPDRAQAHPEDERAHQRQAARDALRARLAAVFGVATEDIAISRQRGAAPRVSAHVGDSTRWANVGLSIGHERGVSLIAWHGTGLIGVDVVRLAVHTDAAELARVAQLYLEPNRPPALAHQAQTAMNTGAFLSHWACHEARLKCAGLALVEWSDALATQLAGIHAVPVKLPPWAGDAAGAVAWRWCY